MNRFEMLLTQLMEECAEVQQVASKILRFGPDDCHPKNDNAPNEELLRNEINDIHAIIGLLADEGLNLTYDHTHIERKRGKVEKYLKYSAERGTLTEY
jgi:hypothetical protein